MCTGPTSDPGERAAATRKHRRRQRSRACGLTACRCAERAPATARTKLTIRGPQREAIESSIRTIVPVRTAVDGRSSPAGRRPSAGVCPQQRDVGEHDDVGALRDDVLGRELRVAAAARVGGVGDVLQPEERVDLADERARGRRVEVGPELVVDGQAAGARRAAFDELARSASSSSRRRTSACFAWPVTVPSCGDLRVRLVEGRRPRPGRARGCRARAASTTRPFGS